MKHATLSVVVLFTLTVIANGKDVAVVVDVSGSMSKYGTWQPDAARLVQNILEKGSPGDQSANWSASGDTSLARQFRLSANEQVKLIKFGSIQPGIRTFFPVETVNSPQELRWAFPAASEFRQARTNKDLATAVAVREVGVPQGVARLVSISDFLSDADLNHAQQEFVNSAMQGTSVENRLVFSWNRNPRVMIRLQQIKLPGIAPNVPELSSVKGTLELMPASLDTESNSLTLRWRSAGPRALGFDVKVVTASGDVLVSKTNLIASEVLLKDPPSGEITWTVSAHYGGGAVTTASRRELLPDGGIIRIVIAVLLLGALAVAAFFLMRKHSDSITAGMKRVFGRSGSSDL